MKKSSIVKPAMSKTTISGIFQIIKKQMNSDFVVMNLLSSPVRDSLWVVTSKDSIFLALGSHCISN